MYRIPPAPYDRRKVSDDPSAAALAQRKRVTGKKEQGPQQEPLVRVQVPVWRHSTEYTANTLRVATVPVPVPVRFVGSSFTNLRIWMASDARHCSFISTDNQVQPCYPGTTFLKAQSQLHTFQKLRAHSAGTPNPALRDRGQ
jgi:hypothetical protein